MRVKVAKRWIVPFMLLAGAANMLSPVAAAPNAPVIKVGQRVKVELKKEKSANFVIGLSKGSYMVLCDTQAATGEIVVQGSVKLLKANGSTLSDYSGSLFDWYEFANVWRSGKTITLKKPLSARLRIANSTLSDATFWLTVLPAPVKSFPAFGWGASVTPVKIGSNNGSGGTFALNESRYYRATLPPGKWSVSLGLRPVGDGYVNGDLTVLDANALWKDIYPVNAESSSGDEARNEIKLVVKKPTTFIFRARNRSNNGGKLEHDVTVEKSTD